MIHVFIASLKIVLQPTMVSQTDLHRELGLPWPKNVTKITLKGESTAGNAFKGSLKNSTS